MEAIGSAQLSFGTLIELRKTFFWGVTPQKGVIGSKWKLVKEFIISNVILHAYIQKSVYV